MVKIPHGTRVSRGYYSVGRCHAPVRLFQMNHFSWTDRWAWGLLGEQQAPNAGDKPPLPSHMRLFATNSETRATQELGRGRPVQTAPQTVEVFFRWPSTVGPGPSLPEGPVLSCRLGGLRD